MGKSKKSSIEIGDDFRDQVADLLRASGYEPQTEVLLGSKKVDIYFEDENLVPRKFAVEAKNWNKPLLKKDLETIYGGYAALLQNRTITDLLIVAPHALTAAAAKTFINETANVEHLSFNAFQERSLGFHNYLRAFCYRYEEERVEDYFIPPVLDDGVSLTHRIADWIQQESADPIAVIAGYGMGKTTLARHVAHGLAKRFLGGEACRIPILIPLGAISREQSLQGLLGAVLAGGDPSVQRYTFPLFQALNRFGRFLIILDGFDEMKHMMSEGDFRANFDELNKLVALRSKVILLGRPTAFLSEDERSHVLRGARKVGGQWHKSPGAPRYTELNLNLFTPAQARTFIANYFKVQVPVADPALVERRQRELDDPRYEELIARPVHARMLADLATDPEFEIKELTRFALYDHFIDQLIKRECLKEGRSKILQADDWRQFASELAWHLWTAVGGSNLGCRVDDLPEELFEPYDLPEEDRPAVKRALLSGSFLDEKANGVFFYAHRSFQEFLVSEYIWNNLVGSYERDEALLAEIDRSLSEEVFGFLIERKDDNFFRSLLGALIDHRAGVEFETFLILLGSDALHRFAATRNITTFSAWDAGLMVGRAVYDLDEDADDAEVIRIAQIVAYRASRKPTVLLAAIKTIIIMNPFGISGPVIPGVIALLFARADEDLEALSSSNQKQSRADPLREALFDGVSAEFAEDGKLLMTLDLVEVFRIADQATAQPIERGHNEDEPLLYSADFDAFFAAVDRKLWGRLRAFYERDARTAQRLKAQEKR